MTEDRATDINGRLVNAYLVQHAIVTGKIGNPVGGIVFALVYSYL